MERKNPNKSIFLLGVGVLALASLTFFTVLKSNLTRDYVDFKIFKAQINSNKYLITQGAVYGENYHSWDFIQLLNQIDLSAVLVTNSHFLNFWGAINNDVANKVDLLVQKWNLIYRAYTSDKELSSADIQSFYQILYNQADFLSSGYEWMSRAIEIIFAILVIVNIFYFTGLIVFVFYLTNVKKISDNNGLMSVRNALIKGQEQERLRISLELHDKVAQDLFAAKMIVNEVASTDLQDEIHKKLLNGINLIDQSIKEVRDLSYSLRPPAVQATGLDVAFKSYVENFSSKIGIPIRFSAIGLANKEIEETIRINLYRVLQETLNNTAKHAHADSIDVRLIYSYPYLLLKIEDDGLGFNIATSEIKARGNSKLGLPGIKERVSLLGGELIINTSKGEGTKILIKVPVESNEKF